MTEMYTILEYQNIKRLETIAKKAKDLKPISEFEKVYKETEHKLKVHRN